MFPRASPWLATGLYARCDFFYKMFVEFLYKMLADFLYKMFADFLYQMLAEYLYAVGVVLQRRTWLQTLPTSLRKRCAL
jgi:predicted DCC family thiol-disulfide oxidoreductase YuxK